MPSIGAATLATLLSPERAAASRRNGARSRGPRTEEGRARSSQNALKHGLRAQKHLVLPDEDAAAFQVLEAAMLEELAPEGALQAVLARRVVAAAWRLERAERLAAGTGLGPVGGLVGERGPNPFPSADAPTRRPRRPKCSCAGWTAIAISASR